VSPDYRKFPEFHPDSGAETAFLVALGQPIARAAQHRPVPEHQS
jgi:hypothetical protein